MARSDDKVKERGERVETLGSLIASLEQPVDRSVVRGGYNQLSEYLQRSARSR
ncbi:MAG: hypothetical protein V2J26_02500 [Pacificimonas sp.]|nr:hypothetical protein [Pacificimonas sp.]